MKLQPDHLVTFAHVAHYGSISAAAKVLHRSQPAISIQLGHLRDAVGEALYRRHRNGITLTAAGEALLPHALAISRVLASAEATVDELKGLEQGVLRIAASMTVAVYLLPSLLARFRRYYPKLDLRLLTRNTREALVLLESGMADLCFIEGPISDVNAEYTSHVFVEDEIILVVRPDHPFTTRFEVTVSDLNNLEVVSREVGSGTREIIEQGLKTVGADITTVLEATGLEAVKEAVLQGVGAAFLSRLAVRRELEAYLLTMIPVQGLRLTRSMMLLHLEPSLCSQATIAFLKFLETEVES